MTDVNYWDIKTAQDWHGYGAGDYVPAPSDWTTSVASTPAGTYLGTSSLDNWYAHPVVNTLPVYYYYAPLGETIDLFPALADVVNPNFPFFYNTEYTLTKYTTYLNVGTAFTWSGTAEIDDSYSVYLNGSLVTSKLGAGSTAYSINFLAGANTLEVYLYNAAGVNYVGWGQSLYNNPNVTEMRSGSAYTSGPIVVPSPGIYGLNNFYWSGTVKWTP